MKKIVFSALVCASFAFGGENMLVKGVSGSSVDETVSKFTNIVKEKGMKIFGVYEHSKLAKEVGLEITPTTVVAFGSPKVGTLLMQCAPEVALDLPLKFLVYKNNGQTTVAYEDIKDVAKRYNVKNCPVVDKISQAQANLLKSVSK